MFDTNDKTRRPSRRDVLATGLRGGLGAWSLGALGRAGEPRGLGGLPGEDSPNTDRNLVLLQLAGGNDGLDTLIPHGDDAYHAARPRLRVAARDVLAIDELRGFHPQLEGLHQLYDEGSVAIVEGVGYPQPNRSHFKSFEIWHAANLAGRVTSEGWVGRLQRAAFATRRDPNRVVHLGSQVPFSLHSKANPPTSFVAPALYHWAGDDSEQRANKAGAERPSDRRDKTTRESGVLDELRRISRSARRSSEDVRRATDAYEPRANYPDDAFSSSLRNAAALLNADIGTRIVSVELGGFDTHSNQVGRRRKLLRRLDQGLTAFVRDLRGTTIGENTAIVVFSEFGRRLAENASRGTDHGTASALFVLGPVRGGLYGKPSSLVELDERGDPHHTVDFRAVYATLIERWMGANAATVLGASFEPLPFLG